MNRVWRHDLAWAGVILGVGLLLGLMQHWELVHKSWQGELTPLLSQVRDQRRAEQFQGVKTVNLAQAYALFQQGSLFIDARPADEFDELHVPKSLNITPEHGGGRRGRESRGSRPGPGDRGVLRPG